MADETSDTIKLLPPSPPNPPSFPLQNRVAIITGASRGIGRAIALHLASLGARLVLNYASSATQANELAATINSSSVLPHPQATTFQADVSNAAQAKSLFDHAHQVFGPELHILVNSAGVLDPKYPTLANTAEQEWDWTFNTNTKGVFLCCREAANRLVRGGGGRIVTLSSSLVGGLFPGYAAYAASKAAVETMTKILAKELKGTGITTNCVAPGPIATELFFSGRSEEMIKRVVDMCPLGGWERRRMLLHWWGFWLVILVSGLMARLFVLMVAMSELQLRNLEVPVF